MAKSEDGLELAWQFTTELLPAPRGPHKLEILERDGEESYVTFHHSEGRGDAPHITKTGDLHESREALMQAKLAWLNECRWLFIRELERLDSLIEQAEAHD